MKLTKRAIDALPTPEKGRLEHKDDQDRYLRLIATSEGRRTWRYIRKVAGRTRFVTIGTYPDTTPDMARQESRRMSGEYDAGRDPAETKKAARNVKTWNDLFNGISTITQNRTSAHGRMMRK